MDLDSYRQRFENGCIETKLYISLITCLTAFFFSFDLSAATVTVGPGGSSTSVTVEDGTQPEHIDLTLSPASGWRIVSGGLDSGSGWTQISKTSYRLNYDPQVPVSAYYTADFSGKLEPAGGGGDGGGETTLKDFSLTANVEVNTELKIGDSGYQDGKPWDANFTYRYAIFGRMKLTDSTNRAVQNRHG